MLLPSITEDWSRSLFLFLGLDARQIDLSQGNYYFLFFFFIIEISLGPSLIILCQINI